MAATREISTRDPSKTVIDVMLSKGIVHQDELEFVRSSLTSDSYPTQIAGFELLSKIGEGSMGVVYKVRQLSLDRVVALKILSPRLARNARYVARFQREAKAVARLSHPNIVGGIDVGVHQGYHYFAMELVEGRTVQDMLEEGPVPEKRAVEICAYAADALAHAWDRGLVHRDIKPGNIVITRDGQVKITDLGLAKFTLEDDISLTDTGTTLGTAYYLSPEQARGERAIDTRSDIYSLGATLFHMLTGQPPYRGTPMGVMTQHVSAPVPDPKATTKDLSEDVCAVIKMMMAKDRRDRYRGPEDLAVDLRRIAEGKKPQLARVDMKVAALADAARFEEEAEAEMVTPEEMRRLKKKIGWSSGRLNIPFAAKAAIFAAGVCLVAALLHYALGLLK